MTLEGAKAMTWIKQHGALLVLLLVLGAGAVLLVTGKLQFNSTGRQETEKSEKTEAEEEASHRNPSRVLGNEVVLDADALKTSGIRTAPVSKGSIPVLFQAPGEVQFAEDRIARVTPPMAGVARAVYKGIGDRVERDSPLCLIESVDLGDARLSYVAALAETKLAEQNHARLKQLFDKGLRTQNELIATEAELTRAKLKREAASAKLRGLGASTEEIQTLEKGGADVVSNQYTLRSPIGGSVLQRNVTTGQSVAPADQLFFVADLSEVWVQAVAHEQDLPGIRLGTAAAVRIANMPENLFRGKVTYIGQQVDEKTRTVPLRVLVRNAAAPSQKELLLRPRLFTNIEIEIGRRRDVPVIPIAAVQSDGSEAYVFVRSGNALAPASGPHSKGESKGENARPAAVFERRAVQLGVRDGQMVEVKSGLQTGEQVVVENAFALKGELEKSKVDD